MHLFIGVAVICLLTLSAHAQEGYGTCLVCVCVCNNSSVNIVRFYVPSKVRTAFVQALLDFQLANFR